MDNAFALFIVDDDELTRDLLEANLAVAGAVEVFETAEQCMERLAEKVPGLLLLDVGLPGMDGYEFCRIVRSRPETANVPVIFVSGHDDLESRLAGYDAGGDDFVVKPYGIAEIHHKVESVRRAAQEQAEKQGKVAESEELVSMVLSNLDEYARLIRFLRQLNECSSYLEIADALLEFLRAYKLKGVIQIRMRNFEATLSDEGMNRPLELSVINHIRTLERIFEFKTRAAYNFDHLTVMVNNMPVDNPELCGSIRDNVAIAAESADAKLLALQAFADGERTREEILGVLNAVREAVQTFSLRYNTARYKGAVISGDILDSLLAALAHIGLATADEDRIVAMVRNATNTLIDLYDIGGDTQTTLLALNDHLEQILDATA
ncbi:MAG: response regulator [Rhodocyclales bacterium]|nr:response regulator [Rhodocyclales bacterium]